MRTKNKLQNINTVWADLIVEELRRCGVEYFCVAPGSRSAPLAVAVANPYMCQLVETEEVDGVARVGNVEDANQFGAVVDQPLRLNASFDVDDVQVVSTCLQIGK